MVDIICVLSISPTLAVVGWLGYGWIWRVCRRALNFLAAVISSCVHVIRAWQLVLYCQANAII